MFDVSFFISISFSMPVQNSHTFQRHHILLTRSKVPIRMELGKRPTSYSSLVTMRTSNAISHCNNNATFSSTEYNW